MKAKRLSILLWTGCCIFIVIAAAVYWGQRSMLFPRHAAPPPLIESEIPHTAHRIWLPHEQGRTEAWLFVDDADKAPQPLVVFAHGNAELIDYQTTKVNGYRRLGFAVALLEYRGYGRSSGTPSEKGIVSDGIALIDRLIERTDIDKERIIYHGRSLGGGVLASLSTHRPPAAIILESTFRSVVEIARGMGLPGVAVRDPFNTESVLRTYRKPVLIIHGQRDEIIPVSHARQLDRIAVKSTLRLLECGHNDCPPDTQRYWNEIQAFLVNNKILAAD